MGTRGPVPKRSTATARARDAKRSGTVTKGQARGGTPKAVSSKWCAAVRDLYNGCKASGQADFYEQSDWAVLWITCDLLNKQLQADRPSAQMIQTLMGTLTELMVTEGARRRLRVELGVEEDDGADLAVVSHIDDLRKQLGG